MAWEDCLVTNFDLTKDFNDNNGYYKGYDIILESALEIVAWIVR